MRRILCNICLLILIALPCRAVSYQPMQFQSTSSYVGSRGAGGNIQPQARTMSAISASNFNALNSEGGACYLPSGSGPRRGRPTSNDNGGTGAIGNYDLHSPIGDTPWWLMIVCACAYAYYIRRKQCSKQQNK